MGQAEMLSNVNTPELDYIDIMHSRMALAGDRSLAVEDTPRVVVPAFKRLDDWKVQPERLDDGDEEAPNVLTSTVYFATEADMDLYMGTLLSLRQTCNLIICTEFETKSEKELHYLTTKHFLPGPFKQIQRSHLLNSNMNLFFDMLIFLSKVIANT
jgi:hypothetical protein